MRAPDRNSRGPDSGAPPIPPGSLGAAAHASISSRQMQTFLHELSNLIDGSLRSVRLARRELGVTPAESMHDSIRRLDTAASALTHIVQLIHGLQAPLAADRGSERPFTQSPPLSEAILHAVEVLRPLADERRIAIDIELSPSLAGAPPTPLYAVIANAVRNSIEAIGTRTGGQILVRADALPEPEGRGQLVIEVCDDGPGPPAGQEARVFEYGFSTKEGASGVGLALASDIVAQLGGHLELRSRDLSGPRPGAMLRIVVPFQRPPTPPTGGPIR